MIWVRGVEYGTAAQLAGRFQVSVWTVYKWRERDRLTTVRINGRDYSPTDEAWRIDRAKQDETRGAPRLEGVAA